MAPMLFDKALALHQSGRIAEAEPMYRRVLQEQPDHPGALHLLGVIRQQQGRHEEALELIGRAIAVNPAKAVYRNNCGAALQSLGRHEEAVESFQRALEICPNYADALANLGMAQTSLGHDEAALTSLRRALDLEPQHVDALKRCAALLKKLGRASEAVPIYQRALATRPTAQTHLDFAELLSGLRQHDLAIHQYRLAIELAPELAEAQFCLGSALMGQGRIEEASASLRRAVELKPDSMVMHSSWLFCQQYRADVTPAGLAVAHAEWDQRHAAPLRDAWRPFSRDREARRTLRLGFVSHNFRQHPVGFLTVRAIEGLRDLPSPPAPLPEGEGRREAPKDLRSPAAPLPGHHVPMVGEGRREVPKDRPSPPAPLPEGEGRRACEIFCYSDVPQRDAMTERFIVAADRWLDVQGLSDEELAEQIRDDRIDILFDLGGHMAGNRLLVFARRPAPIQVKWVGYPGSSGLTAMDYLLADRYHAPVGEETYHPEKVLRLPDGYVCFDPPADAPEIGPLPALGRGHVTFGSFNNPAKTTPSVVATWAEILRRVPGARLLLRFAGFEQRGARRWYEGLFAASGIGPDRFELLGWSPHAQMLADCNRVDLALDPFPYSGGVTTCEALWMGVPVITCPGKTFAGRHSLSHLSVVGLTETVVRDMPDYIDLAVRLARDLPRLAKWRSELRGQVARSPLCDGPRFAANLMETMCSLWEHWIAGEEEVMAARFANSGNH